MLCLFRTRRPWNAGDEQRAQESSVWRVHVKVGDGDRRYQAQRGVRERCVCPCWMDNEAGEEQEECGRRSRSEMAARRSSDSHRAVGDVCDGR